MNRAIKKYLSDDPARVHLLGLQLNDLASLVAGVKFVVYTNIMDEGEDRKNVERLCSDLRWKTVALGAGRHGPVAGRADILIGPDVGRLNAAAKHYPDTCSLGWGTGLGYPECCVSAYIEWRAACWRRVGRAKEGDDLVHCTHRRSPRGRLIPFWMNNVWNFYSRLNLLDGKNKTAEPDDAGRFAAFSKLNEGLDRESFIPWHPCSYGCAETREKGRRIYEVLAEYMPHTAKARRDMLSKPVFFWDKFRFAVLDGRCRKEGSGFAVDYAGIGRPRSLLRPAVGKALARHASIRVSGAGRITSPRSLPIPADYAFLPFSF